MGFLGVSDCKEPACNIGDLGLIPGLRRSSGEGNGYPLQYSCLENSMDREDWWGTVNGSQSQTWWVTNAFYTVYLGVWVYSSLRCLKCHVRKSWGWTWGGKASFNLPLASHRACWHPQGHVAGPMSSLRLMAGLLLSLSPPPTWARESGALLVGGPIVRDS